MTSHIDASYPRFGNPTTVSVRDQFAVGRDEITDLQMRTQDYPYLPLSGGIMLGPLTAFRDPIANFEVATKHYVDTMAFAGGGSGGGPAFPDAPITGGFFARGGGTNPVSAPNDWTTDPWFTSLRVATNAGDANIMGLRRAGANSFLDMGPNRSFQLNTATGRLDWMFGTVSKLAIATDRIISSVPMTITNNVPVNDDDVATKLYVDQYGGAPIGSIVDFAGDTAPLLWLICDGRAVSRTTYARLFAVLGTKYGTGNGTTTFNLPDLRCRIVVGADVNQGGWSDRITSAVTGLNCRATGQVGGSMYVHVHNHPVSDPGHAHGMNNHVHGIADPGHAHIQPNHHHPLWNDHSHGVGDPSHNHGVSDPGHAHGYNRGSIEWLQTLLGGAQWGLQQNWEGTGGSGVGVGIYGNGTGIWIGGTGNFGTAGDNGDAWGYAAGTGIWTDWASDLTVHGAGTGVTVGNTGLGTSQNVQPSIVMNKIIFAGA